MGTIIDYFNDDLPCVEHGRQMRAAILIDHPAHYGGADNIYEAINVIEAWQLNFCLGNVIKYINRAGKKGSKLEDLKKAQWYLAREIEKLEKISH
jgi:hypothetical protein